VTTETFAFEFDPTFRLVLLGLGVTPGSSGVTLDDETFDARFGPFRLRTPVSNLKDVQITRDYRWYRAIGPRVSRTDLGATFGTNTGGGVCVCFHKPVKALFGVKHPGLTVTVGDLDGLAAAITRRLSTPA
jgi:hypothetical protein